MIGMIVLGVIGIYIFVLIAFTFAGYRIAVRQGWSGPKPWLGAAMGFALIFLPLFWDAIPTLWMHRHYCESEAGLKIYKTLDQWKAENPGEVESLVKVPVSENAVTVTGVTRGYQLNQRFRWEIRESIRWFGIGMYDERLVDTKNGEVLAKFVDFSTRIPNWVESGLHSLRDIKFWMDRNFCEYDHRKSGRLEFGEIEKHAEMMGAQRKHSSSPGRSPTSSFSENGTPRSSMTSSLAGASATP
jgi:hypothetical protein